MDLQTKQKIADHLEECDWEGAARLYQSLLSSDPEDAEAWHGFGVLASMVGRSEVALRSIGRAIELDGDEASYHLSMAEAYRALGRSEEALGCLRHRVALSDNESDALIDLAQASAEAGELVGAVEAYTEVLGLRPHDAALHNDLGTVYAKQTEWTSAIECYRAALASDANFALAHNNLGAAMRALGRPNEAIASFEKAIECATDYAVAHLNLAIALEESMRLDESEQACRRALSLDSGSWEARLVLSSVLQKQGRLDEAQGYLRDIVESDPSNAKARNNLAVVLGLLDQPLDAAEQCQMALAIRPDFAEAHYNLGNILKDIGQAEKAIGAYRQAVALRPEYCEAWNNLGVLLAELDQADEAVTACRRAVEVKPSYAEAHYNLGNALRLQRRLEAAASSFRRAIEVNEEHHKAHNNLGGVLQDLGRLDDAIDSFRESIRICPADSGAHMNLAFALLLSGRFAEGWHEFEWRRQSEKYAPRAFPKPEWDGGDLNGRTILLHSEQGFGDSIQFIRYGAAVKERGAGSIVVQCQRALLRLFTACSWIDELADDQEAPPPFDVHAPLMELPSLFRTTPSSIPAETPYLYAEEELVSKWREALAFDGLKVGLAWQGNPKHLRDRERSIPLHHFQCLGDLPGVRLYSLQKSFDLGCLDVDSSILPLINLAPSLHDFAETAAAIRNLDLVISCDTAVAHLSGALGCPTWLLLPTSPDWRWFRDRDDSPWYPSMHLWRQATPGMWAEVIDELSHEIRSKLAPGSGSHDRFGCGPRR